MFKRGLLSPNCMEDPWWRRPSVLPLMLVVMAFLIIVVGGSIRINDAGESCPEWPTCFGTWHFVVSEAEQAAYWDEHPEQIDSRGPDHRYTTFQIFVEWFHRLLVGVIAVPILANVLLARSGRLGEGVFPLAGAAAVLLVVQAFAGYITVEYDNADWTVALHLSLASIFLSLLMYQYMRMRVAEGATWPWAMETSQLFLGKHSKRMHSMAAALGLLLVLGAWVSSSAGGQYNQSCSVGFPNGWPKCQGSFLPSLEGPGIFIQMIHRVGALVVGLVLVMSTAVMRNEDLKVAGDASLVTMAEVTTGVWFLNLMVGGSYIVFAKMGDFPEWLSLLHLVVGVTAFFCAMAMVFAIRIAGAAARDREAST